MSPPVEHARARRRALLLIAALVVVILAGNVLAADLAAALDVAIRPRNEDLVHRLIMASAVAYAFLLAIPFVPGVEIGLAIIGVLGPNIVPLIYLCTLAGLSLSFLIGRLISLQTLARACDELELTRTGDLLRKVAPMSAPGRLEFLVDAAPRFLIPFLLRHRYLALAVALNLPGNFLLGGGGGIGLVAGVSGLYAPVRYFATIALAVTPVPIAVLVFGSDILGDR